MFSVAHFLQHTPSGEHSIAVQFVGQPWEQLRSIPVDREGEYTFSLRPRTEAIYSRMLCEVKVESGVKIITLRSTYRIRNQTLYPVEIGLSDEDGRTKHDVFKLGRSTVNECITLLTPLQRPVMITRCPLRPSANAKFAYSLTPGLATSGRLVSVGTTSSRISRSLCAALMQTRARPPFVSTPLSRRIRSPSPCGECARIYLCPLSSAVSRRYPKIDLSLRAPIELENLLPYNLQYRIYDKDTDQNWRSYLRKGGVMPVHSVELGHLVLLNVEIQDTRLFPFTMHSLRR